MPEQRDRVRELAEKALSCARLHIKQSMATQCHSLERIIREELRELLDSAETAVGTSGIAHVQAVARLAAQLKEWRGK